MTCQAVITNTGNWGGDTITIRRPNQDPVELRRGESLKINNQGKVELVLDMQHSKADGDGFLDHPVVHVAEPVKYVR